MKKTIGIVLAGAALLAACSAPKQTQQSVSLANGGKVWASLWQQRAAEYKALCFQAYNLAKLRLDEALAKPSADAKPMAVVTDIDETLLDNSPYDAMRALNNQEYTLDTWKAWTAKAEADTVPGAPAFFKYAASKVYKCTTLPTAMKANAKAPPGTCRNMVCRLPTRHISF